MAQQSLSEKFDAAFEKEKQLTKEDLADVLKYLSHDTSTTRIQLAAVLRERADVVESSITNSVVEDLVRSISDDPTNEGSIASI